MRTRFTFVEATGGADVPLCQAVFDGMSSRPKTIPARFFYDLAGSHLFEAITELPEYYLTRAERRLLERDAGDILDLSRPATIVEFGSGSSVKTRLLIEAALVRRNELLYCPIDISLNFLKASSLTLLDIYPDLLVDAIGGEYFAAIDELPAIAGPRLILFLGSNIGNMARAEAVAFLSKVRSAMAPEDSLLVGTDLVKDTAILEAAYNDRQGVTAQFNLNLLERINRELGGTFDLKCFRHFAPFDHAESRIEMRLVSMADQTAFIEAVETEFEFAEGEAIVTEWSHKYTLESFRAIAQDAGLQIAHTWYDENRWFAEHLLKVAG